MPTAIVVDPNPDDYEQFQEECRWRGCELRLLHSAEQALSVAGKEPPDIWLLHACLPDASGVELLTALLPQLGRSPVFLVSDHYDPAAEIAALRTGRAHYLCKPLDAYVLCEAILAVPRRPGGLRPADRFLVAN